MRAKLAALSAGAKTIGPTFAVNVGMAAIGLVTGILLARTLGPERRGDAAAAVQWATITLTVGDFGIGFALAYFVGLGPHRGRELWGLAILLAAIWGTVLTVLGGVLVSGHVQPGARGALRLAFLTIPPGLLAGYQGYLLLGTNRVAAYNASRLGGTIAYALLVGAIVTKLRTAETVAIAVLSSNAASAVISAVFLARHGRPEWRIERGLLRGVVTFGAKTQCASIAGNATLRLDQLLLSVVVLSADLGQYAVAVAIAGVAGPLYSALATVVIPAISKGAGGGRGANEALKHTRWAFAAGIPIVVVGTVVMPVAIRLTFGDAFIPAVLPARILLFAGVFQGVNAILGNALRTLGNPTAAAIAEGWGLFATVVLLAMLLRPYGIVGAAVASLTAYATVSAVLIFYVVRARRIPADAATIEHAS